MVRTANKTTPVIIGNEFLGEIYVDGQPIGMTVGDWEFQGWLAGVNVFYFQHKAGTFTARLEPQRRGFFWYAYRRIQGKTYKLYIGKPSSVDMGRMVEIAKKFSLKGGDADKEPGIS
jgi:hypothetical protein